MFETLTDSPFVLLLNVSSVITPSPVDELIITVFGNIIVGDPLVVKKLFID